MGDLLSSDTHIADPFFFSFFFFFFPRLSSPTCYSSLIVEFVHRSTELLLSLFFSYVYPLQNWANRQIIWLGGPCMHFLCHTSIYIYIYIYLGGDRRCSSLDITPKTDFVGPVMGSSPTETDLSFFPHHFLFLFFFFSSYHLFPYYCPRKGGKVLVCFFFFLIPPFCPSALRVVERGSGVMMWRPFSWMDEASPALRSRAGPFGRKPSSKKFHSY